MKYTPPTYLQKVLRIEVMQMLSDLEEVSTRILQDNLTKLQYCNNEIIYCSNKTKTIWKTSPFPMTGTFMVTSVFISGW